MLFGLDKHTIDQIHAVFRQFPQIDTAIIYGSRAMGKHRNGSDIDLTLQGDQLDLHLLAAISNQLDDLPMLYSFDLSCLQHIDNPQLLDHIRRVGKIFYQNTHSHSLPQAEPNQ